jgi:methionine-rich copper-binding protein CopC
MKSYRSAFHGMFLVGGLLVSSALPSAEIKLASTDPPANAVVAEPPYDVRVSFNEPPDLDLSTMEITGPSKTIALTLLHDMGDTLMAVVSGDMPDGTYAVRWQTAGGDKRVLKGEFSFTVKRK